MAVEFWGDWRRGHLAVRKKIQLRRSSVLTTSHTKCTTTATSASAAGENLKIQRIANSESVTANFQSNVRTSAQRQYRIESSEWQRSASSILITSYRGLMKEVWGEKWRKNYQIAHVGQSTDSIVTAAADFYNFIRNYNDRCVEIKKKEDKSDSRSAKGNGKKEISISS